MAKVPRGPGQLEVTGDLRDAREPEPTGLYRDPQSGAELEVTMGAGADALVRMGWEFVRGPESPTAPENRQGRAPKAQTNSKDVFTETKASSGEVRYFINGKRVKVAEYEAQRPA